MSKINLPEVFSWIIKIGLWIIPFLPIYVSSSMLFPFITGKNFAFRIIIDILFIFWVGLLAVRPYFRPRLSILIKFSSIFILVLFLADLFSPNPYRSFFSNYERMEGFMMLFHLWLYFLMLASVFKEKKDWLIFFHTTLAASLVVAFIGLLQKFGYRVSIQGGFRIDSTIGNSTYLAAYLSFHIWLLVIFLQQFWNKIWLRPLYAATLIFELLIIFLTASRGVAIALAFSVPLLLFLSSYYWFRLFPGLASYRKWVVVLLLLVILTPLALWQLRNVPFVSSNLVLHRLTDFSLRDRTTQSRFSIWQMSLKGVRERPILGWGQENYYLVFQKYFDPKLWSSEPWFDRSHNIALDWLVHAGILGFLGFFSMIGAVFWLLLRGLRGGKLDPWQGIVIITLFVSYLIQNIFVFDNLNTYLLLFAFFAYTDYLTSEDGTPINTAGRNINQLSPARLLGVSGLVMILVLIFVHFWQWKPILESKALLEALQIQNMKGPPDMVLTAFKKALSYNTFGDTEVREQLANTARSVLSDPRLKPEEQKQFIDFAAEELRKEINRPARDIKHLLFLASILSGGAHLDKQYATEAEALIKDAIKISPTKQILYFELAQLYLRQQRFDAAIDLLNIASNLDPNFTQARANLVIVATLAKRLDIVNEVKGSIKIKDLDEDSLSKLGLAYRGINDFPAARPVYEALTTRAPVNPQYHAILAALLLELGELDRAEEETNVAARLDNSFAPEAKIFLQIIRQRRK